MKAIIIEVYGKGSALAELDERNPIISEAIWQALPIEGRAILWGEEVYFDLDMKLKDENPSASSEAGDICYWSPGPALCIFFGQTQPYSRVNHIGKVVQGLDLFERINAADRIVLRKKELVRMEAMCQLRGEVFLLPQRAGRSRRGPNPITFKYWKLRMGSTSYVLRQGAAVVQRL